MYKLSQYCVFNYSPENELVLFNTLTGSLVKFKKTQSEMEYLLNKKTFDFDQNNLLHRFLKKNMFIVLDGYDEYTMAEKYCRMMLANSKNLSLIIMPTFSCNFRCVYCYEDHQCKHMSKEVLDQIILYIKENLENFEHFEIQWFGGEPLLRFEDILYVSRNVKELCVNQNKTFSSSITTNGYLLNGGVIQRLFEECNVRLFQITLDGLEEAHNAQRPHKSAQDSFCKVWEGLIALKNTPYDFQVIIRTNITRKIMQYDMCSFFEKMRETFGADKRFSFMVRKAFGLPISESATTEDMTKLYDLLYQVGLKITADYYLSYGSRGICYASKRNHYCIGPEGEVYKCSVQFNNQNNYIGSLLKRDFETSSNLAYWENASERLQAGKKICKFCEFYPICAGISCPANAGFDFFENKCTLYENFKIVKKQILVHSKDANLCINWDKEGRGYGK